MVSITKHASSYYIDPIYEASGFIDHSRTQFNNELDWIGVRIGKLI